MLFFLVANDPWWVEGLTALISGMGTVFVILILISFVISLFKYISAGENKHDKNSKVNAKIEETPHIAEAVNEQDDLELIAVITAAVAVSMNTSTDKLRVKSLRRVNKTGTK